jgi:branched-chain amino acid transport system permease protein
MEFLGPVLVSGLTTGAIYALATLGLSLVWGAWACSTWRMARC